MRFYCAAKPLNILVQTKMSFKKMSEHTPAPLPQRAVYGFAYYLLFLTLLIVYFIWAIVPTCILEEKLGLYYLPDKYFALSLPILILCSLTFFAAFLFPSINLSMTPNIGDINTVKDSFTVYRCQYVDSYNNRCDNQLQRNQWTLKIFCKDHEQIRGVYSPPKFFHENEIGDVKLVCSFCKTNHNCKLHPTQSTSPRIPSVRDIDLADVCKELFQ